MMTGIWFAQCQGNVKSQIPHLGNNNSKHKWATQYPYINMINKQIIAAIKCYNTENLFSHEGKTFMDMKVDIKYETLTFF